MTTSEASLYSDLFLPQGALASSPSPFLDLSTTRIPHNLKRLYPLLEWFGKMDNTISPVVYKTSIYPIMPLDYTSIDDKDLRVFTKTFMEKYLKIRTFLMRMNSDYNVYGDAFGSVFFPFKRMFRCVACSKTIPADSVVDYHLKKYEFYFKCPHCHDRSKAKKYWDMYVRNPKKVSLLLWRPHDMRVVQNPFTGECQYIYTPSSHTKKLVNSMDKFILDGVPEIILRSLRENRPFVFAPGKIFHMSRTFVSSSGEESAYGFPMILPCILPGYLKRVYDKATEVSGVMRSSPAHVVFPESSARGGEGAPLINVDGNLWQQKMRQEFIKQRRDPGYVMFSPTPVGQQVLFADAKQLNYTDEAKAQDERMLMGMGAPRELIQGSSQYTAASVALRIFELQLEKTYNFDCDAIEWVFEQISSVFYLGANSPKMRRFKMADDLQLLQMQLQAVANGDMSIQRVWNGVIPIDWDRERELIKEEDREKFDTQKARQVMEGRSQITLQDMFAKAEAKSSVQAQTAAAREITRMQKQSPEFSGTIQQQQSLEQQQMMAQQMQLLKEQTELKAQQQDRLTAESESVAPENTPADETLDEAGAVNKLVTTLNKENSDPVSVLNSIMQKDWNLYEKVVRAMLRSQSKIQNPRVLEEIMNFIGQNSPHLLQEVGVGIPK